MQEWNMGRAIACSVVVIAAAVAVGCGKAPAPAPAPADSRPLAAAASIAMPAAPATQTAASTPAAAEALAWLEGRWCGSDEDQQIEETWFAPKQDETTGMSRTISGGRVISFEYMRIASLDGKLTLLAQPDGNPPVPFERTDGDKDWIRFENPKHDYPQRIQYRRVGDELHAEVGGPGANGQEEIIPYVYKRCDAP
jgi:hypothetical protein